MGLLGGDAHGLLPPVRIVTSIMTMPDGNFRVLVPRLHVERLQAQQTQ
jgi:hypothetical protein